MLNMEVQKLASLHIKHKLDYVKPNMSSPTPSSTETMSLTSSDGDAESLVTMTKCHSCHETYTQPKVLTCFHSFCQPCLEKLAESSEKLACPECGQVTALSASGVTGLLPDFAITSMLEASVLEGHTLHCTGCKSKETCAEARCIDCANFLCGHCVMAHQFMHCFEGHRVLKLNQSLRDSKMSEKSIHCLSHRGSLLKHFCHSCISPICSDCLMVDHKGHKYSNMIDAGQQEFELLHHMSDQAKVKANDLRSSVKSLEHASNRIRTQFQKAQTEVNETYNFYKSILDERRVEALKELETGFNGKVVSLTAIAQKMKEAVNRLYQGSEFIDKLIKHAHYTEILLFKKMVDSRLTSLLSYNPDINSANGADLEFVSNYQAIQAAVRNTFGYIRQSPDVQQNKPGPISRPTTVNGYSAINGYSAVLCESSMSSSARDKCAGLFLQANGNYDPFEESLLNSKHFPSNSSLSNVSITSSINGSLCGSTSLTHSSLGNGGGVNILPSECVPTPVNSDAYTKWSNGAPDLFANDIFSTAADPMIDLTPKVIAANIYPPKSQIKRQKMIYHCKFGEFGVLEGQFTEPSGVAVNAQNDIIVADTNNHRIQIFDKEGRFKFQFGECGKRDGQLLYPNRVAVVKPSGDIVVTERSPTHQVQIYNQYGQFVRKFGANVLQHPRGVTVDHKGRVIIVECKVMRVIIFDQVGNVIQKFGCSKHLEFPNGVVVNDHEEIFISDNRAHCVKVFNYQGVYLRQIGGEGITNYPIGVGINAAGEILVADNHNNFNLTVFSQDGQLISALESKVKHAQCFDVALMEEGSIVLASKDYRLYVYRYLQIPGFNI